MTLVAPSGTAIRTIEDLLEDLAVDGSRVLLSPPPGRATVQDVIAIHAREGRLCELVDDTLVEKTMGLRESLVAGALIAFLRAFVVPRNLGIITGESGMLRLLGRLVRIPDVAFISWGRMPGGRLPEEPVPALVPDVAVEVLSASNTPREMERKRREYFEAGVRLVWIIDIDDRSVSVHTGPQACTVLSRDQWLDGGDVLPGFSLPLADLFAELDRSGAPASS